MLRQRQRCQHAVDIDKGGIVRYRSEVLFTVKRRALVAVISLISTTLLSEEVVPRHWVPEGTLLTIRVASPERLASELAALGPEGRVPNLSQFVAGFLGLSSLEGVAEDRAWYAFWVEEGN